MAKRKANPMHDEDRELSSEEIEFLTSDDSEQAPPELEWTDEELSSQELERDSSPLSAEPLPEEVELVGDEDMPVELPPTDEELGHQYSQQFLDHLLSALPDLNSMMTHEISLWSSSQQELMEQIVEGFNQALLTTRTTTFTDYDDMCAFLVDFIQCIDALTPVIVGFTVGKFTIRSNRPT